MSSRCFRYESFDNPAPGRLAVEEGPEELTLHGETQAAIEEAQRQGFEAGRMEGFAAGREAAARDTAAHLDRALPEVLTALRQAAGEVAAVKHACERDAFVLVRAALRQILPLLAERALASEIAAFVADVIAKAPAPAVEISAAATTCDAIERFIQPLPNPVRMVRDHALPEGKVLCCWTTGDAWFDSPATQDDILAILDRSIAADASSTLGTQAETHLSDKET